MIPVIMKGETSKPIQLALKEGYEYSGCALHVNFCGLRDTFVDLAAGGSVELRYTAEQTARLPLGTSKVMLSIENARNEICFMPWAKIKVTDCPEDVRDAQVTIDPATLNVDDLTAKDSLASVKSRLNAVLAFLRGLSSLAVLALPLYALSDVAPLTAPLDDIPGDTPLMTNVVSYVDAKVAAIPGPDYSTGNTQLVATIEAKAPAPGNYAAVSNRAMSALQSHQSLAPSTNYTDAALGSFASTGTVARATVYGTPTRWTDATGCVWEVTPGWRVYTNGVVAVGWTAWNYALDATADGVYWGLSIGLEIDAGGIGYTVAEQMFPHGTAPNWDAELSRVYEMDSDYNGLMPGDAIRAVRGETNLVGRVALTNDIPDVSGYTTQQQATNAATAVADTKISTNNAAFVAAVTNCPVSHQGGGGADWPIGDFGQYGTIGAIIAALVAASTWLKSHLRYELHDVVLTGGAGTLLDRAGNRVVVTGDTTLTLPAAVPGYCRDFLVRLEISGSTVPTITFAAPTGETITYETDGDEFPVPDEAGTWSYSFTENCVAHKFAVSLKKVNEVAQGGE